jgi:hypothetical protein
VDSQHGQAAVEWVGLLLAVTLVLGALLALAPNVEGRSLGAAIAHAITCTAGGRCGPAAAGSEPVVAPRVGGASGLSTSGEVSRPPVRPPPRFASPRGPVAAERAAAAFHVLRGVKRVASRAWIVCLGYKRFQYERRHPEFTVASRMPLREALRIADSCLNPATFLGEDG